MVIQGTWTTLNISDALLIRVAKLHTHPALSRREGLRSSSNLLFAFSTQIALTSKVISLWLPINQSLIKPGWFLSVFTDNLTSVSVPRGHDSKLGETGRPRLGNLGESSHCLSRGHFTTFSLKGHEVLIKKPGNNRHYLRYMINISWAELRVNWESQEDKTKILCWFSWGLNGFLLYEGFFIF